MEQRRRVAYRFLRILAVLAWVGAIVFAIVHRKDVSLDLVLNYTPDNTLLAVFVLLLFFVLKSLTVVFYSGILYAASGLMFPLPLALAVSLLGTLIMSLVPYVFARGLGVRQAETLRGKYPKLREFETMRSLHNFAFVVALRCVNIVNHDVGSMYCGAAGIPLAPFLLGSLVGKVTDIVMFSVLGTSLERRDPMPFFIALAIDLSIALLITLWSRKHNSKEEEQHE